jgi:hypothetical protein
MSVDECCSKIIQSILHTNVLDIELLIDELQKLTNSENSALFDMDSQDTEIMTCRHSTMINDYTSNNKYNLSELPDTHFQFPIWHKSNMIVMIVLSNKTVINGMNDEFSQKLHDTICVGLVMDNMRKRNYKLNMKIFTDLSKYVTDALLAVNDRVILQNMLSMLTNVTDLLQLEYDIIPLKITRFDLHNVIYAAVAMFKNIMVIVSIDKDVPKMVSSDRDKFQQIMVLILQNLIGRFQMMIGYIIRDQLIVIKIKGDNLKSDVLNQTDQINYSILRNLSDKMRGTVKKSDPDELVITLKIANATNR